MPLEPLVVDLDGTLIHSDTLHESAVRLCRDRPLDVLCLPLWVWQGRANLKQELASRTRFDPSSLPYNHELLAWLRQEKRAGRRLILCTAADRAIADSIAQHLGIFDEVMASNGQINLSADQKAKALVERFAPKGYDYVGNSRADLAVWAQARVAVVVNASPSLLERARAVCRVERVFNRRPSPISVWLGVLRVHQWLKNLLLFVPLVAAHEFANQRAWLALGLGFVAFSLCASAVYIANDLFDLETDRAHPRKRSRAFASGLIPIWLGVAFGPVLLGISYTLSQWAGPQFSNWLLFYFLITCAYSWVLKEWLLIDCITLALLYTIRVVAGAALIGHQLSFWLLAFSVFLFLSLAFLKRYAEFHNRVPASGAQPARRAYLAGDAPLIQTMGIVAGYASVLVLALYLNSEAVLKLYVQPVWIWAAVPVMLFWISWMWTSAHRGLMNDDPLVFALRDRVSLAAGASFSLALLAGAMGIPWSQ